MTPLSEHNSLQSLAEGTLRWVVQSLPVVPPLSSLFSRSHGPGWRSDHIIVITDERAHDLVPGARGRGYMINVATNKDGVGYVPWTYIDGWSAAVVDYIRALEQVSRA